MILDHAAQKPLNTMNRLLKDVAIAGSWDLDQMLAFNKDVPESIEHCVHDVVSRIAADQPDKEAIYSTSESFTYGELDDISTRLAHHLIDLGVQTEDIVPTCFEKSAWTFIAMVAIMKAGCGFVPFDPTHPPTRHQDLIEQTGAKVMICSPQTAKSLSVDIKKSICLSSDFVKSGLAKYVNQRGPPQRVRPYNIAYILFTSGSTGKPKGVIIEHRAILSSIHGWGSKFGITPDSRVLQFANYIFDGSLLEGLTTLVTGGTLCVPSDTERLEDTVGFMERAKVTMTTMTTSFLNTISPDQVPSLKTVVIGGEAPTVDSLRTWMGRVTLVNGYGPAEAAIACAAHAFESETEIPTTIGKPTNTRLWVVDPDDHQQLAPFGCVGELAIQSHTLARGYLGDTSKTKAAFIDDIAWLPEAPGLPRRIYKTGDLVKHNAQGLLEYCGRKDGQIKIRGQRVELGEVEHVMKNAATYIKDVVVETVMNKFGKVEALAAFVTLNEDIPELAAQLSSDVGAVLPKHMLPTYFIQIDRIPRTGSDKVDRKGLKKKLVDMSPHDLSSSMAREKRDYVAAENGTEERLRSTWSKILDLQEDSISTNDNFYSLGGDSIRIVTLSKAIAKEYGVKLSLSLLNSKDTTISTIARFINGQGKKEKNRQLWRDVTTAVEQVLPSSISTKDLPMVTELPQNASVFLTGATGFLGAEILRQLLDNPTIGKVITHVRAETAKKGLQRIKNSASIAQWWKPELVTKLEIWTGDLAEPSIGLDTTQISRILGTSTTEANVDAIIHNGAIVNWNADYDKLYPGNVDSTLELLKAAISSPLHPKFVFVSGGIKVDENQLDRPKFAHDIGKLSGYIQTKFVAESIVYNVASRMCPEQNRVSLVKPGRIIGRPDTGIANTDDFLWRVTSAAAAIGVHPDESDGWLDMNSVDKIASTVTEQIFAEAIIKSRSTTGGLSVPRFWSLVNEELERPCKTIPREKWMDRALQDMNEVGEEHPLWPVQHFLGRLSLPFESELLKEPDENLKQAVRMNVRYLMSIGMIEGSDEVETSTQKVFKRSAHPT